MAAQDTTLKGFPDPVGGRSVLCVVDHQGPASYTTGGETFPQQGIYGGPNSLGLRSILWCSGGTSEGGLYRVIPIFGGGGGVHGTIKLQWWVISTGDQVAADVDLSGSVIRLLTIGG